MKKRKPTRPGAQQLPADDSITTSSIPPDAPVEEYKLQRPAHVPADEMWFWSNVEAVESVRRGLADASAGRVHDLGSFVKYADLEID